MSELLSEVRPPAVVEAKTTDDIQDIFNQIDDTDDKVPPKVKEKEVVEEDKKPKIDKKDDIDLVDEEEEEKIDLTKDDEEDEQLDEEEIDLKEGISPRKKELLKDYPDLFKKHPYLEKMLYRDRQYNELFGSFDDAKEVAEKAEIYNNFEQQLLSGKTEEVIKNVKETDPEAFNKIVDDYLPTLHRVDKDAYFEVIGNVGKQLIMEMVKEAKASNNEQMQEAALMINQFLFGTSQFTPPKQRSSAKPDEAKNEIEAERLSFINERFETSRNDLQTKVDNVLRSTISQYIDPRNSMTAYVKKNAVNDALRELQSNLGNDTSLRKLLDNLWRGAFDSKFSRESLSKIQSAYLGRAKTVLPAAIKKARAEALKDLPQRTKREKEDEDEEDSSPSSEVRRNIAPGRPSQPNSKSEMKKGESVMEFFNRD